MEPSFQWIKIGANRETTGIFSWFSQDKSGSKINNLIVIMGALIQEPIKFRSELRSILYPDTTLCFGGELKSYGGGLPAANFRYKKDVLLNDNVIQNYFHLIKTYKEITGKPIIITTIPRQHRKYSFSLGEDGSIMSTNTNTKTYQSDKNLMSMLNNLGVSQENMKKIRQSCSGSKFKTYLIDMISFLYQLKIDTPEFHSIFTPEYRGISSVRGGNPVGSWIPDIKTSYMYMNKTTDKDGIVFFVPKESSIETIYNDFDKAISPVDNEIKHKIRDHCCQNHIDRWTDFDVNDIDDAFTILMIIHSFTIPDILTEEEQLIKTKLQLIMEPWFAQLKDSFTVSTMKDS